VCYIIVYVKYIYVRSKLVSIFANKGPFSNSKNKVLFQCFNHRPVYFIFISRREQFAYKSRVASALGQDQKLTSWAVII